MQIRITHEYETPVRTEIREIDSEPRLGAVKPMPVDGVPLTAVISATDEVYRKFVDARHTHVATWLGWHRGQTPAGGASPEEALQALLVK